MKLAEKSIELLSSDNKELRNQNSNKDALLNTSTTQVEATNQELSAVLSAKNSQIERLRDQTNKQEVLTFKHFRK